MLRPKKEKHRSEFPKVDRRSRQAGLKRYCAALTPQDVSFLVLGPEINRCGCSQFIVAVWKIKSAADAQGRAVIQATVSGKVGQAGPD